MINVYLNIRNPFSDRWKIIKTWAGISPFKNKFWEVQIDKCSDIICFELRYTTKQDHAGLFLCLALFGYEIIFNFYDNRHWDYQNDKWEDHNEKL